MYTIPSPHLIKQVPTSQNNSSKKKVDEKVDGKKSKGKINLTWDLRQIFF